MGSSVVVSAARDRPRTSRLSGGLRSIRRVVRRARRANDSSINRQVPNGRGGTKECQTSGTTTNDRYPEHTFNWDVVLKSEARSMRSVFKRSLAGYCSLEHAHRDATPALATATGALSVGVGFLPVIGADRGLSPLITGAIVSLLAAAAAVFHPASAAPATKVALIARPDRGLVVAAAGCAAVLIRASRD